MKKMHCRAPSLAHQNGRSNNNPKGESMGKTKKKRKLELRREIVGGVKRKWEVYEDPKVNQPGGAVADYNRKMYAHQYNQAPAAARDANPAPRAQGPEPAFKRLDNGTNKGTSFRCQSFANCGGRGGGENAPPV
jgi:hypothetical protein